MPIAAANFYTPPTHQKAPPFRRPRSNRYTNDRTITFNAIILSYLDIIDLKKEIFSKIFFIKLKNSSSTNEQNTLVLFLIKNILDFFSHISQHYIQAITSNSTSKCSQDSHSWFNKKVTKELARRRGLRLEYIVNFT